MIGNMPVVDSKMTDLTPIQRQLSDKQRLWIEFYCGESRCNATDAARRAGYADPEVAGWRLKQNWAIMREVEQVLTSRTLSSVEVLARLTQHANGTLAHFLTPFGTIDLNTPEAQANLHLLKKVKVTHRTGGKDSDRWSETTTEIELHDPQAALMQLGKFHTVFDERNEERDMGLVKAFLDGLPEGLREGVAQALRAQLKLPYPLPDDEMIEAAS